MWESDTEDAAWDKGTTVGAALKVIWSQKTVFRENRVFGVQNDPKWPQNGPNGGPLGPQRVNFAFLRVPEPVGML